MSGFSRLQTLPIKSRSHYEFRLRGVKFERDGTLEGFNRGDQAGLAFASDHDTFQSGQRACFHAHAFSFDQERIRLGASCSQPFSHTVDFFIGQRGRLSIETYESEDAGMAQDLYSISETTFDKDIAGKQREQHLGTPALPVALRTEKRQIRFHGGMSKMVCDYFFMARKNTGCIPARDQFSISV